ncbi:MAG: homocysteine S-methyltransferase family protein [Coriobacteriales bacterium]|jgi:methionine synthase I (cobalamin-dependent)|nr:homocysteine S-methyltransferase family protein [Coriobacteriales bacterium]
MADLQLRLNNDMLVVEGSLRAILEREGALTGESELRAADAEAAGLICEDARAAELAGSIEYLNILDEELVCSAHERYVMAGAQCALTNTVAASRPALAALGLGEHVEQINRVAVRAAHQAGFQHVLACVGSVMPNAGPVPDTDRAFAHYSEQIRALVDEQPDAIILVDFTDLGDIQAAVRAAQRSSDLPVIVGLGMAADGSLLTSGEGLEQAVAAVEASGVSVVGIGSGLTIEELLPLSSRLAQATQLPLYACIEPPAANIAHPSLAADDSYLIQASHGAHATCVSNEACPSQVSHGTHAMQIPYPDHTEEIATAAVHLRQIGVQFIGVGKGSVPADCGALFAAIGALPVVQKRPAFLTTKERKVALR